MDIIANKMSTDGLLGNDCFHFELRRDTWREAVFKTTYCCVGQEKVGLTRSAWGPA